MNSLCIYFSSSTSLYCASDALKNYGVPHKVSRLSENLAVNGCTRCLKISPSYRFRALSAMNEHGCRYLEIKEAPL